jgi:hypothetical protein
LAIFPEETFPFPGCLWHRAIRLPKWKFVVEWFRQRLLIPTMTPLLLTLFVFSILFLINVTK